MFRYDTKMRHKVCWSLHKQANVEGIFFQSKGHFDRSCVKHKYIVHSCCEPKIDDACQCGETLSNGDKHEVEPVEKNKDSKASPSMAARQGNPIESSYTNKTQYFMALAVTSIGTTMALLIFAIKRLRLRNSLTTTTIDCGAGEDLEVSALDLPSPFSPYSPSKRSTNSSMEEKEEVKEKVQLL